MLKTPIPTNIIHQSVYIRRVTEALMTFRLCLHLLLFSVITVTKLLIVSCLAEHIYEIFASKIIDYSTNSLIIYDFIFLFDTTRSRKRESILMIFAGYILISVYLLFMSSIILYVVHKLL